MNISKSQALLICLNSLYLVHWHNAVVKCRQPPVDEGVDGNGGQFYQQQNIECDYVGNVDWYVCSVSGMCAP